MLEKRHESDMKGVNDAKWKEWEQMTDNAFPLA